MVNFCKPIGIPHSIILENLFAAHLRRQQAGRGHRARAPGLPRARLLSRRDRRAADHTSATPAALNSFTLRPSKGKRVDILIPVEEGERYRLGGITFSGNKAFQ